MIGLTAEKRPFVTLPQIDVSTLFRTVFDAVLQSLAMSRIRLMSIPTTKTRQQRTFDKPNPALIAAAGALIWCLAALNQAYADTLPEPHMFTDFSQLQRPSVPNNWLIAPAYDAAALLSNSVATVVHSTPIELAATWRTVVEAQPRTRTIAVSDDGLRVEVEQRSALFGFIDRISFQALASDDGHATFYAYSRSQTGYWDLGVNRRRLTAWVEELLAQVPKGKDAASGLPLK